MADTAINALGQYEGIADAAGNNVIVLSCASLDSTRLITNTSGTMDLVFDNQNRVIMVNGADRLTDVSAKVDAHGVVMANKLVFGQGITAADLRRSGAAGAFTLQVGSDAGDSSTFGSFDQGSAGVVSPIDSFVFADGSALSYMQLVAQGFDGGETDDTVSATTGNDRLSRHADNDLLQGQGGADTLDGGAGNDSYMLDSSANTAYWRDAA